MNCWQHDWCEAEAVGGVDHWSTFQCERRLYEQDGFILQVGDDSFFWLEGGRSNRTGGDKLHKELSWAAVPQKEMCRLVKTTTENR